MHVKRDKAPIHRRARSLRPRARPPRISTFIRPIPASGSSILHGSPQNAGYSHEVFLTKAISTRHWSDWAGTAAFAALAVGLWRQSPEFGVLILPGLIQELLVAVSFLLRGRARLGAPNGAARLVAYVNSFLVMGFILLAG